ncbi:peptidylprolyl isomerase [Candidatus Nomurabacteria bacterium RIFCSPLOWO2_01_FULL_39_17]|uniref:Peptidyl-prolyl cis-trans isomerase n=1 Tax=Candidatus Nomurabacteria bacterium RIFCSPLOWO2_01_FULL_39_17 TaxID=1801770 RepID=A0A1F6WWC6_9BACT|nr:MAG: peptidylprolyl isomerase [Candidatus Nomurabacteria bacterium RIFCSPLOWO2_01_FULL_39_17]
MQNTQQIEGVKVTILREGNGEIAKAGDTVAMNYTGKLTDGTTFDSNMDPKFQHVEPFVFTIGAGMVIKGWDLGIAGMKIGEKRNLTIESSYAYGSSGAGGVIPPNATLFFDVELLAIK